MKLKTRYLFFVAILCSIESSLCGVDTPTSESLKKETLINHIFLMQELKQCCRRSNQPKVQTKPTTAILTPTQAYLSIPTLRQNVENLWSKELEQYKTMIDSIMAREKEFQDSHYVFYHGQTGSFRIFQDFLKEWYRLMHIKEELTEFDMLRIWYKGIPKADANALLDKYNGNIDNYAPGLQDILLSVNLSLFGNFNCWGSCTFKYFLNNTSAQAPTIRGLIQQMFTECGIDHKHIEALFKLALEENKANLLQIFIPKELVDRCSYLAVSGGYADKTTIVGCSYDAIKGWHTKISPVLDLYQSNPSAFPSDRLNYLQARIILSQDIMLNPDSGVKIFRYTPIEDTKIKDYQHKVNSFAKNLFIEYLQKKINFNAKTNLDIFLRQIGLTCNVSQILRSAQQINHADKKAISNDLRKITALMHKEQTGVANPIPTPASTPRTPASTPQVTSLLSNILAKVCFWL